MGNLFSLQGRIGRQQCFRALQEPDRRRGLCALERPRPRGGELPATAADSRKSAK